MQICSVNIHWMDDQVIKIIGSAKYFLKSQT